MSQTSRFFCVSGPEQLPRLRPWPVTPVLMAYRLEGRLLRSCPPVPVPEGLLGVTLGQAPPGDPGLICRQAVQECRARQAAGVLADWDRYDRQLFFLTRQLGRALEQAGLRLLAPEAYGAVTARTGVLISSALSGGSLSARLTEARDRYGAERVVLALERMSEDFVLPSPSGQGTPLSPQQLEQLRRQVRPAIYWSGELCARYFTYRSGGQVHFVLFDDGGSLAKKLALARELGITSAIAPWAEIAGCIGELGLGRK